MWLGFEGELDVTFLLGLLCVVAFRLTNETLQQTSDCELKNTPSSITQELESTNIAKREQLKPSYL